MGRSQEKGKGRRSPGLWISALILLFFAFCSPKQMPSGFSGWFSATSSQGKIKGKFYFFPGNFLRIEAGGCSFLMTRERVEIFDRRRREKWEGSWARVKEKFPMLPSLKDMEEIWRGRGVIARTEKGYPKIFLFQGWTVQLLKIKRGANPGENPDYPKVRLERICSRFVR